MIKPKTLILKKPFGFVVIDKPIGLTSHDCVNRLRKIYGIKKIGHAGTLDPAVTGVLPIAIGDATRLISYLEGSKGYKGLIQLGSSTTTDDMQGDVIDSKSWPLINKHNLDIILNNFRGTILQTPPIFSSVHFKGERAYKKARRGEEFHLTPRKVTINELNLISWSQQKGELEINIDCSSGTYIRALARDIGNKLECGAHLKYLRRTKSHNFTEQHSILLPDIYNASIEYKKPKILNPKDFLNHLLSYKLSSEAEIIRWRSGREINLESDIMALELTKQNELVHSKYNKENILVLYQNNDIAGIACSHDNLILKPKVVFNAIG